MEILVGLGCSERAVGVCWLGPNLVMAILVLALHRVVGASHSCLLPLMLLIEIALAVHLAAFEVTARVACP